MALEPLPAELIALVVREAATSVDESQFEHQLALTARISSNWTTFSEEVLHSNIVFNNQAQAKAYVESGSAGKYKTKVLELNGDIESETIKMVMGKMRGLEEITVNLEEGEFDMNILQDDRFSGITSMKLDCKLSFNPTELTPFPFTLSKLHLETGCIYSLQLLDLLLFESRFEITDLLLEPAGHNLTQFKSILRLGEFENLHYLDIPTTSIDSLNSLNELFYLSTLCCSLDVESLKAILAEMPKSFKLMGFEINLLSAQITEAEMLAIMEVLGLPALQQLRFLTIRYIGVELACMKEHLIAFEKRGINANFFNGTVSADT